MASQARTDAGIARLGALGVTVLDEAPLASYIAPS
jgi:hypothetical protein